MTALGVHLIDTMHYLVGPVARVSAYSKAILEVSPLDEVTAVLFEFVSGPIGYLGSAYVTPKVSRLAVSGTEGIASVDNEGAECRLQRSGEATGDELTYIDNLTGSGFISI